MRNDDRRLRRERTRDSSPVSARLTAARWGTCLYVRDSSGGFARRSAEAVRNGVSHVPNFTHRQVRSTRSLHATGRPVQNTARQLYPPLALTPSAVHHRPNRERGPISAGGYSFTGGEGRGKKQKEPHHTTVVPSSPLPFIFRLCERVRGVYVYARERMRGWTRLFRFEIANILKAEAMPGQSRSEE